MAGHHRLQVVNAFQIAKPHTGMCVAFITIKIRLNCYLLLYEDNKSELSLANLRCWLACHDQSRLTWLAIRSRSDLQVLEYIESRRLWSASFASRRMVGNTGFEPVIRLGGSTRSSIIDRQLLLRNHDPYQFLRISLFVLLLILLIIPLCTQESMALCFLCMTKNY